MFGDLFDTIGGWIDTGVDYDADLLDYEDTVDIGAVNNCRRLLETRC